LFVQSTNIGSRFFFFIRNQIKSLFEIFVPPFIDRNPACCGMHVLMVEKNLNTIYSAKDYGATNKTITMKSIWRADPGLGWKNKKPKKPQLESTAGN